MIDADYETNGNSTIFMVMAALTLVGSVIGGIVAPPTRAPASPMAIPVLFLLGLYFAVCSTWFQDFVLYRLKVARAVYWYGESTTHLLYRILGFGTMGASLWLMSGLV